MTKPKIKKAKVITKKEVKVIVPKKEYKVYVKINGIVTEVETNDIASTILGTKPEFPKTPMTVRVTKGGKTVERYLLLQAVKRLYYNEVTMEMFIRNLLF